MILADRWFFIIPLSCILIYGASYDLSGVVAAITIGYTGSGTLLAQIVFRSDWAVVALQYREGNDADMAIESEAEIDEEDDVDDDDEEESDDDSSTGFG